MRRLAARLNAGLSRQRGGGHERDGGPVLRRPVVGRAAVAVVLVAAGALFATSARTADGSDLRGDDTDLRALVATQQREVVVRDARLARLRALVDAQVAAVPDATTSGLRARAGADAAAVGLDPVTGEGLEVTLADAPQAQPRNAGVSPDVLIVHQQDLQAVVNALWAGGASALQLEDQRIIATSAVRCVGNTLKLQGRLYAPPYTVKAVGDPARLRASLQASPDVRAYLDDAERVGLGWSETSVDHLTVRGWTGSLQLVHARVPASGATGGGSSTGASTGTVAE